VLPGRYLDVKVGRRGALGQQSTGLIAPGSSWPQTTGEDRVGRSTRRADARARRRVVREIVSTESPQRPDADTLMRPFIPEREARHHAPIGKPKKYC